MSYGGLKYLGNPSRAETEWLLDQGAFFDRCGANKMPILMSNEPVIKALLLDIQNRKWVDLKRADIRQGLEIISTLIPSLTQDDIEKNTYYSC